MTFRFTTDSFLPQTVFNMFQIQNGAHNEVQSGRENTFLSLKNGLEWH